MNSPQDVETDIKRVGKSGQISLGKQHAGQYFREERQPDGSIILVPVVVLSKSHWSVRDHAQIREAIAWAGENLPEESDLDALVKKADKPRPGNRRGR
jgi:hypothetical protein